jgi:hypothetical protein
MLQAQNDVALNQAEIVTGTALPFTLATLTRQTFFILPITVPLNELWQVSFCGFRFTTNSASALVTVEQINVLVNPSLVTPISLGTISGAVGGTCTAPIPVFSAYNAEQGTLDVSISLNGVNLQRGDVLASGVRIFNGTAGNIDVTAFRGLLRYLPIRLVSEIAVAGLQQSRQDQLLDARLRASRG